ncbi:YfcE family phosphodiesterase [Gammaproteobacteria bacterium]|nr:YfcE family phosphodiesterase [Gammaproteobacteria bacterium]
MCNSYSRKTLKILIIGVTGDTHNNLKNISIICDLFNELRPSLVIHTGDITLPKSLKKFSKLKMPLVGVYGNNDIEEKDGLNEETKKFECKFFDEPHLLRVDSKNIIIIHHPELIDKEMIMKADYIVHGHTHRFRSEIISNTLIFNPGECAGFLKGKNQIGYIDTEIKKSEIINF